MGDAEPYSWELRAFHTIWLQQLEQGRVNWADEEVKLKYRRTVVWHHVVAPSQSAPAPCHQPQKKQQRGTQIFNVLVKSGSRAYVGFSKGTCTNDTPHPTELNAYS